MKKQSVIRALSFACAILFVWGALVFPASASPNLSAKSAILMEAQSGKVLYQQNAFVRLPMASTTKIMTAIVAIEAGNIGRTVTVSPDAVGIEGSSIYLYPEEKLTLEQLIYALLLESANDAATAIAIEVAGSVDAFAVLMNRKAEELGLCSTHFTNPHGLDHEDHYTTAYDLARMAAHALQNETFRKICSTSRKTIPLKGDEGTRVLVNHNKMLSRYDGAIGVKTGFTKRSGRCLVSAAERDGLTLVAVTLGAPDDWNDHAKMLDYGFERYERKILAEKGELTLPLSVVGGNTDQLLAANTDELSVMLTKRHGNITWRVEADHTLYAPIARGTVVGRVIYSCDGEDIASSDLVALTEVPYKKAEKKGFFAWLKALIFRD